MKCLCKCAGGICVIFLGYGECTWINSQSKRLESLRPADNLVGNNNIRRAVCSNEDKPSVLILQSHTSTGQLHSLYSVAVVVHECQRVSFLVLLITTDVINTYHSKVGY